MNHEIDSKPTLSGFNPKVIPYQYKVIEDIRRNFDYSKGNHEILLSGSFGSAKSILMAHIATTHAVLNPGSCVCLARKAMPDLKRTIFKEIKDHIAEDLNEGSDYYVNDSNASIRFKNGSNIISSSCADKRYTKVRSLKLSMVIIEELIELNDEDKEFYQQLKARLRRIPGIEENILLGATNPDSPAHWAHEYFIESKLETRHVYYSNTFDNPFLDPVYINQLKSEYDEKMAQRFIYGKWIEIATEVLYYAYDKKHNFRDYDYIVDTDYPIHVAFDFNIAVGKPLSAACFQFIDDEIHIFNEVAVEGMRTEDACEELAGKGILDYDTRFIINGDAAGKHRDTRSKRSDYDIIKRYFENYEKKLDVELKVPSANPPIRNRHNRVNAYCCNAEKPARRRLFVYKDAPMADKGLRLTQLKKGGNYIEDDSKEYQHITTAIGYGLISVTKSLLRKKQGTVIL